MWLNDKDDQKREFIRGPENNYSTYIVMQDTIKKLIHTASYNPGMPIILWYDSTTCNVKSIEKTYEIVVKEWQSYKDRLDLLHPLTNLLYPTNVRLKDIRELPYVKENSSLFSPDKVNVFSRADQARLIVSLEDLKNNHMSVYSDLDVTEFFSKKNLFNLSTLRYLAKYSFVLPQANDTWENGFHIMQPGNPHLVTAITTAILGALKEKYKNMKPLSDNKEIVFNQYLEMLKLFYYLQGWGTLSIESKEYTPIKDDASVFISSGIFSKIQFTSNYQNPEIDQKSVRILWAPTVSISLPPQGTAYKPLFLQ